jgi:hypothetical protein
MGASGAGLFADDVACDVRAAYRDLLADGLAGPKATKQLLRDFRDESRDHDDGPVFWLALAATQWELGRLEDAVKAKALDLIDSGTALDRWAERSGPGIVGRRKAVLDKLRRQLASPQPAEKAVRKPRTKQFIDEFAWPVGGVFGYRLRSGRWVLFLVAACEWYDSAGYTPIFTVLDWTGLRLPPAKRVAALPVKAPRDFPYLVAISRESDADPAPERVKWLPVVRPPAKEERLRNLLRTTGEIVGGYGFAVWGKNPKSVWYHIDDKLRQDCGWK